MIEAESIEQLSAIGYLAGSEQAGASQGVTQHDPQVETFGFVAEPIEIRGRFHIVVAFDPADGWTIETKKNTDGKIVGAVWSGGSVPRGESVRFRFTERNPTQETTVTWRMVQIHADGSRVEWAPDTIVGAPPSRPE